MKISIIGPAGAGKTTFAKKLSVHLEIPVIHSDDLYLESRKVKGIQEEKDANFDKQLVHASMEKNWIIEGPTVQKQIVKQADKIILLKPPFVTAVYRQWKRYFTDQDQREMYSIKSNIALTKLLIKMYFENPTHKTGAIRLKKIQEELGNSLNKLVVVKTQGDLNKLLSELSNY